MDSRNLLCLEKRKNRASSLQP